ncbi:MAG: hypothetical protein KUG82_07780 [Pseudomonadales bacterium]|mgnify:CR=1 FL=1|nr:hypothetical protein [Pseudomonadales bacterium]
MVRVLLMAFVLLLSACGEPKVEGEYVAQKKVLFMTMNFAFIFSENEVVFNMPALGKDTGNIGKSLKYKVDGNKITIYGDNAEKDIYLNIEEDGQQLRLTNENSELPEIWKKSDSA